MFSENSVNFGSLGASSFVDTPTRAGVGDMGAEILPSDWSELAVGGDPMAANSPISGSLGGDRASGRAKSLFWNMCWDDDIIHESCDPEVATPPP